MALLAVILTQTSSPDPTGQLVNLGIGALVAAPFVYLWRDERKQRIALDERYRVLLERVTEVLVVATSTLSEVQKGMADQVERASLTREGNKWDIATRRLELAADELRDEVRQIRGERGPDEG